MRFNNATKDEQGRRNSAKKDKSFIQSSACAKRWKARERADEKWAREVVWSNIVYDDIRR